MSKSFKSVQRLDEQDCAAVLVMTELSPTVCGSTNLVAQHDVRDYVGLVLPKNIGKKPGLLAELAKAVRGSNIMSSHIPYKTTGSTQPATVMPQHKRAENTLETAESGSSLRWA